MTNPTDDPKDAWIATQVLALIDAGRASGLAPTELEARCIIAAALGEFTDEALQRKAMNRRTAYLAAVLIAKTYALFDPQYTNGAVYGVQVIDTRTGLQVEAPDTMIPVDDFQAASQLLASRTIAATANEDPALVTALFKSTPETICFTSILFLLGFIGDAWCRRLIADGLITEEQMRAIDTRRTCSARSCPTIAAACSKLMFSSCAPASALVAGVKIGAGRRAALLSPAGSATPQTRPLSWYSFQPDPAR